MLNTQTGFSDKLGGRGGENKRLSSAGGEGVDEGDAAGRIEVLVTFFVVALGDEDPEDGATPDVVGVWGRGVAVGHDDKAVVFRVRLEEVEDNLEVCAATAADSHFRLSLAERDDGTEVGVERHSVDTFDPVAEEAVDDRIEVGDAAACHAGADVDGDEEARLELVETPHISEASAPVGPHTSQSAARADDAGAEAGERLTVVDTGCGRGDDMLDEATGDTAPALDIANDVVDLLGEELVLLPEGGLRVSLFSLGR